MTTNGTGLASITTTGGNLVVDGTAPNAGSVAGLGVSLTTTNTVGTGHLITLDGAVNGNGGDVTLTATGGIGQNASGVVNTTGKLTGGSSAGNVTLDQGNTVANLGAFNVASGTFTLNDTTGGLNVTGAVTTNGTGLASITTTGGNLAVTTGSVAGLGVTLTTTGNGNGITLNGGINGNAGDVTLKSASLISQTATGLINTTGTLTGSAATSAILDQGNAVANLGAFTTNGTFTLVDAYSSGLTVTGVVTTNKAGDASISNTGSITIDGTSPHSGSVTGSNITLTTTTSGSNIILNGYVTDANVGTVTLNSAGDISQNINGVITATNLVGSTGSTGTTTAGLYSANNLIANLGTFTTHGDFALKDTLGAGLNVTGTVNSGTGSVVLNSASAITENQGASITTGTGANTGLLLLGTGILDFYTYGSSNSIPILAAYTTGTSSIQFMDNRSLVVGTVNDSLTGTPAAQKTGITATGMVELATTTISGGNINGDGNGAASARITTTDTSAAGGVILNAAGGIGIAAPVYTTTTAGTRLTGTRLNLTSNGNGTAGDISLIEDNTLNASRINLVTNGSSVAGNRILVTLGTLAKNTFIVDSSKGTPSVDLTLNAPNSSIVNSAVAGVPTTFTVTANTLTLQAGVAIGGTVTGADPINTAAAAINAISSDSALGGTATVGGIYLSNNQTTNLTALATTIGGSSGAIDVANTSGMLTVGSGGVTSSFNTVYLHNPSTALSDGITLATGSTVTGYASAGNTAVSLSADQLFVNKSGASAVIANGGGRWLVYSSNPANDTFGPVGSILISGNYALWNTSFSNYPITTLTGNRYLFAYQPTVSFIPDNLSKTYGQDYTTQVANVTVTPSGFYSGNGSGNAFIQEDATHNTFTGSTVATSTGSAATAHVSGSPYPITLALATLANTNGNAINLGSSQLIVNPAPLTVTANSTSKNYGQTVTFTGIEFGSSGLQIGETIGSVTLASAGAAATAHVLGSPYTIIASNATGGTFTPSDYAISYVNGLLTINPVPLIVTANNASKTYGQTLTFVGTEFTVTGLQNGQTVGSVSLASLGAVANAIVGSSPYPIIPSNATGGTFTPSDYLSISYVNGLLTVNPLPVIITGSRIYDSTTNLAGTLFSATNRLAGDSLSFGGSATADSANVGTYTVKGLTPNSLNIANLTLGGASAGNYTLTDATGNGTIDYRPITLTAGSNFPGTRNYGDTTNPTPTVPAEYTVGGLGMAGGENAKTLLGFTVGSAANSITPAGVYLPGTPVAYKVSGVGTGINGNYQITAIKDGTLTISAKALVQELEPKPAPNYPVNASGNTVLDGYIGDEDSPISITRMLINLFNGNNLYYLPQSQLMASNSNQRGSRYPINLHHSFRSRTITASRNPMRAMMHSDKYGLKPFGWGLSDIGQPDLIASGLVLSKQERDLSKMMGLKVPGIEPERLKEAGLERSGFDIDEHGRKLNPSGLEAAGSKLSQLNAKELRNYRLTEYEEVNILIQPNIPVRIKPFDPFVEPNKIDLTDKANKIKWGEADTGLESLRDVPTWGLLDNRLIKYPSNKYQP